KQGDRLVFGPLAPHEILKIFGIEGVQRFLVHEVQLIYRSQQVYIDDKHIEVIIGRMVRGLIRVCDPGDTGLARGIRMNFADFLSVNARLLEEYVWITDAGDSRLPTPALVARTEFEGEVDRLEAEGRCVPEARLPQPAKGDRVLQGVTAVARWASPLCAGGLVPTARALAEACLGNTSLALRGLHVNALLGRLIPAGTGFPNESTT
ncbi:MAG TPA: DNA-directed RNA polymerase subunit beta', partial [Gemmataceae bacterium]